MAVDNNRPSLDVLVPLIMVEDQMEHENSDDLSSESPKEILRHFESGDIVLVQLESHCLPAIVFNMSGLVMKFDIDRQLYHVCLLDKNYTERWVDATDMITYSVPMIAEYQNEETMLMWSTANELLAITNDEKDQMRLEEFKRRFSEIRHQQVPFLSENLSRKSSRTRSSTQQVTSQQTLNSSLTTCEELLIIDSIYRASQCTYAEAKQIAEETYLKIVYTNNRENSSSYSKELISEHWFLSFALRQIDHLRKYSSTWLPDLETMKDNLESVNDLHLLISSMKETV